MGRAPFGAMWVTDGVVTRRVSADDPDEYEFTVEGQADCMVHSLRMSVSLSGLLVHRLQQFSGIPATVTNSYILITSDRGRLAADPEAGKLGLLTVSLLDVLTRSVTLETMTYGRLMSEVFERMDPYSAKRHPLTNTISDDARQTPFCTTTSQNCLLFDGLFARRLERSSSSPVITVCYTDR